MLNVHMEGGNIWGFISCYNTLIHRRAIHVKIWCVRAHQITDYSKHALCRKCFPEIKLSFRSSHNDAKLSLQYTGLMSLPEGLSLPWQPRGMLVYEAWEDQSFHLKTLYLDRLKVPKNRWTLNFKDLLKVLKILQIFYIIIF